ncbi:hypothetical protein [Mesorhizobium sp.]|uniref:hypothetical protein n=1 Tax=Mesorhizobium sp. TaxID=1871066 RepID=UPI00345B64DA
MAVVPDHLQEIPPASAKAEQMAAQRIALQNLLDLKAKDGNPFRMSVWPVASHTRTPFGTGIIADQERQELDPAHRHPPSGQPERSAHHAVRHPIQSSSTS